MGGERDRRAPEDVAGLEIDAAAREIHCDGMHWEATLVPCVELKIPTPQYHPAFYNLLNKLSVVIGTTVSAWEIEMLTLNFLHGRAPQGLLRVLAGKMIFLAVLRGEITLYPAYGDEVELKEGEVAWFSTDLWLRFDHARNTVTLAVVF